MYTNAPLLFQYLNSVNIQTKLRFWVCEMVLPTFELEGPALLDDIKVHLRKADLEWAGNTAEQNLLESVCFLWFLHPGQAAAG